MSVPLNSHTAGTIGQPYCRYNRTAILPVPSHNARTTGQSYCRYPVIMPVPLDNHTAGTIGQPYCRYNRTAILPVQSDNHIAGNPVIMPVPLDSHTAGTIGQPYCRYNRTAILPVQSDSHIAGNPVIMPDSHPAGTTDSQHDLLWHINRTSVEYGNWKVEILKGGTATGGRETWRDVRWGCQAEKNKKWYGDLNKLEKKQRPTRPGDKAAALGREGKGSPLLGQNRKHNINGDEAFRLLRSGFLMWRRLDPRTRRWTGRICWYRSALHL